MAALRRWKHIRFNAPKGSAPAETRDHAALRFPGSVSMPRRARPQLRHRNTTIKLSDYVCFNAPKGSAPAETVETAVRLVVQVWFQCPEGLGPS